MHIRSPRLRVGYDPDTSPGCRFDRTSRIHQLLVDEAFDFAASEFPPDSPNLMAGGRGLASEFDINGPASWKPCPVGEPFLKIGVGLLRRDHHGSYRFNRAYPAVHLPEPTLEFRTTGDEAELRVRLVHGAGSFDGSSCILERAWLVRGTTLACTISLTNTGTAPLFTEEYCHNFLRNAPAGGAAEALGLSAPADLRLDTVRGVDRAAACRENNGSVRIEPGKPAVYWYPDLARRLAAPASWRLEAGGAPWAAETLSVPAARFNLWGHAHVVSPELFARVLTQPGETSRWSRTWRFCV